MSLNAAQREKVEMFKSVTNESSDKQASSLLASCGWDVDAAIATHFAISQASGSPPSSSSTSTSTTNRQPAPTATPQQQQSGSFMNKPKPSTNSSSAPAAASSSSSSSASRSNPNLVTAPSASPPTPTASRGGGSWIPGAGLVSRAVGALTRAVSWGSSANGGANPSAAPLTPQAEFLRDFSETYGPFVPDFVNGSYADAVKEARARGRLLFVYLHCSTHDDMEVFVRETLCTEGVVNFLRENFVSWAGTIKHTDPFKLCQTFRVASFPFICVLDASQGSGNTVAVVYRHTGLMDAESLIRELLQRMEMHQRISTEMSATRAAASSQRNEARSLREQQDFEYEESLLMDQGRREMQEREAREMEQLLAMSRESEAAAERQRQQEQKEEEERKAQIEAERIALAAALPDEPAATAPGAVTIAFRLPNSKKVSRRFLDTQHLNTIKTYLRSLPDMESTPKFRILSNFPNKVHDDDTATIASMKLGKHIQLIVDATVEEEENDGSAMEQ